MAVLTNSAPYRWMLVALLLAPTLQARNHRSELEVYFNTSANTFMVGKQSEMTLVVEGVPATRREHRRNSIHVPIVGRAAFVGEWCFEVGIRTSGRGFTKTFCWTSSHNHALDYPRYGYFRRLPAISHNTEYAAAFSLRRGQRMELAWHNLPNGFKFYNAYTRRNRRNSEGSFRDRRRGRKFFRIEGVARHRITHHDDKANRSAHDPVKISNIRSAYMGAPYGFNRWGKHSYRVTAVYADGETRSNFTWIVKINRGHVVRGEIVYEGSPVRLHIFRFVDERNYYLRSLAPKGSGADYLLDEGFYTPTSLYVGAYPHYVNLKLSENDTHIYRQYLIPSGG